MTTSSRSLFLGSLTACVLFALATGVSAQEENEKRHPGVKVGEKAPGFTLKDQQGKDRSLEELLKQGNVALVFHRSADW